MAETTMDKIARALHKLSDVTDAVQNVSIGVVHTANAHEVIGQAAARGAAAMDRVADAATKAADGFVALGTAATKAADAVDRIATVLEQLDPDKAWAEYKARPRDAEGLVVPARTVMESAAALADVCLFVYGCFPGQTGHRLVRVRNGAVTMPVPHEVEVLLDVIGPPPPSKEQPEGHLIESAVPVSSGWTYAHWWDRQGDPRGGSHTGILAPGNWQWYELMEDVRRVAPWAIRVDVRL